MKQKLGVQYDNAYAMVVASTSPDEDRMAILDEAEAEIRERGKWRDYVAIFHPRPGCVGQIIGYRRLNPKDWFRQSPEGDVIGPFPTKRIILRALNADSGQRTSQKGVYLVTARGHYEGQVFTAFTRDAAATLDLDPEELPC